MSQPNNRPSQSEYLWTLIPLCAAVFIVGAYIMANRALITCEQRGEVCDPVDIRPLLDERKWCADDKADDKSYYIKSLRRSEEKAAAGAQSQSPTTTPSPAPEQTPSPSPTPSVKVTAETEGPAQQVTVQVKLPPVAPTPPPDAPTLEERRVAVYSARLPWLLLYAVGVVTNLFALFTALYIVWASLRDFGTSGRVWTLAAVLVAGFLSGLIPWLLATKEHMPVLVPLVDCLLDTDVSGALKVIMVGNGFSLGVSAVAVLASCAALWPVAKPCAEAVAEIARRMSYLRALLYVGMIALVASVLRLTALFHWALSFLPSDDRAAPLVARVTSNVTSGEAAAYTLLLAAIYVPAALVLRHRALSLVPPKEKRVRKSKDGKEERTLSGDEWLEENGLSVTGSPKEILPKPAAILAPLLVGSVGDLLKVLGSI